MLLLDAQEPKKDQIWQRPNVEGLRVRIHAELSDAMEREAIIAQAARAARAAAEKADPEHHLRTLLYCSEGLRLCRDLGSSSTADLECLFSLAYGALKKAKIPPVESRLSYLHGDLDILRSDLSSQEGWRAGWNRIVGAYKANLELDIPTLYGGVSDSVLGNSCTPESARGPAEVEEAIAFRLSGRPEEAVTHIHSLRQRLTLEPLVRLELEWQEALAAAQMRSSVVGMAALVRNGRSHHHPRYQLEFIALTFATRGKNWLGKVPKTASIRRLASPWLANHPHEREFLDALAKLELCYNSTRSPMPQRLEWIAEVLEAIGPELGPCKILLLLAGAFRWLHRTKKPTLARSVYARYQTYSLLVSEGLAHDGLGLLKDIDPTHLCRDERSPNASAGLLAPPTSIGRILSYSKMSVLLGSAYIRRRIASRLGKEPNAGAGANARVDEITEVAEIMRQHMNILKGPFMKLGQIGSYCAPGIPFEAQTALSLLQDKSGFVKFSVMKPIIEAELGGPISAFFSRMDTHPFASGSIGQVYRALTREGEDVAVKVQYPGIDHIVHNDIYCLALLLPILRRILPHWDIAGQYQELRAQLIAETDYTLEALRQEKIRESFCDHPDVIVPRILRTHSTRRVLTAEFIDGQSLLEFARKASQTERDRVAATMTHFHWTSIFRHRLFNTDPHPGNYLVSNGRVAFLDFGNVKDLSPVHGKGIEAIMRGVAFDELARFRTGMIDASMVFDAANFDFPSSFQLMRETLLGHIASPATTRISRDVIYDDMNKWTLEHPEFFTQLRISKECLMLTRAHWSFFATLTWLEPECNWREIFLRSCEGGK